LYTEGMKKRWIVTLVIVVACALGFVVFGGDKNAVPVFESVKVTRGDVRNEVSVTGHVQPITRVDLAFTTAGRVAEVFVDEGAHVLAGAPLARLDGAVLLSQLHEAEARLAREIAVEKDVLAPLRNEERAVKDTAVASAETGRAQAETSARASLSRAFTYADDAIQEEVDELFEGSGDNQKFGIRFTYGTTEYVVSADAQTRAALTAARSEVGDAIDALKELTLDTERDVREMLPEALAHIIAIETFLNNLAETVNRYIPTDTGAQAVYESYQTSVASARTAVASARTDLIAAQKEYHAAHTALVQALNDLELSLAGASNEALKAQSATVALAEYGVSRAREQMNDATLFAPHTGTVASLDLTVGEVVSPYTIVGQFIGEGDFEIEVYVPEADIASVELSDTANVTFDAFERADIFSAMVVRMSLGETYREGVPTYKTELHITSVPREGLVLRPGMTADVDILTDATQDVLLVPSRSILQDSGRTYVRLWDGERVVERDVTVGLRGSDGTTEIVSGLSLDEEIILYIDES
jgi:HlyD family secretion protein